MPRCSMPRRDVGNNNGNGNAVKHDVPPEGLNNRKEVDIMKGHSNESEVRKVIDKGKKVLDSEPAKPPKQMLNEEGYEQVLSNKNKKKKNKNKKTVGEEQTSNEGLRKFIEGMEKSSSCHTEYVPASSNSMKERYIGNDEKGRQPKIDSGSI